MSTVLVTGGSGFVGIHVILQLLAAGHTVRTTVRRPERQTDVLAMLREGGAVSPESLSFSPPTSSGTRAGVRPSRAATTFSMLPRRSRPVFPRMRTR